MSREYQTRPSQLLGIENDYLAYCLDEVCLYLLSEATDSKGKVNWGKFRWRDSEKKTNQDFLEFLQGQGVKSCQ